MKVDARNIPHLRAPPSSADPGDPFPFFTLSPNTPLFRSHDERFAPWWFGSSGNGRFDLASPAGTCYVAESAPVALRETWGDLKVVPAHLAVTRKMAAISIKEPRRLADLTNDRASSFGVTSEMFSTEQYALCQQWASYLHATGHQGLRYWARHDLSHRERALALFDAAGDRTAHSGDYVVTSDEVVAAMPGLLDEMNLRYGIRVLAVPY